MLQFDVVTLFPQMLDAVTEWGVTGRARERGLYHLVAWNPRDFAGNAYRTVDDRPYGGGPGMVMMPEPLHKALAAAQQRQKSAGVKRPRVVYLSPQGSLLDHARVAEYVDEAGLVLLAGRYEGVDERLIGRAVDEEASIGDYVLSGGELAAMVVIDALVRQMPGALGDAESASQDSFANGLLDCPHYTRPEAYANESVPPVLLSGNHAEIARWRLKQALGRTWVRRPELLVERTLSEQERALLDEYRKELE
ncbi:MAG TPA: tRNA (guanosine(37)-N1)-methyltransferase TrmD, partial [Burkholderiales bacterium]|nr:tRNA (guanosine(37)-N1)-methyltransferase TrmD [Burkholderiales bacterium]